MKQYLDLLQKILDEGQVKDDRTGTGTKSFFGHQMRFDLNQGFPILTTKKIFFKGVVYELLWFLDGSTDNNILKENGVHIWDEWETENGDLGPIYGFQWRNWIDHNNGKHIDQIGQIIEQIRNNPSSRRIIVSAWNVADLPDESISPQENAESGKKGIGAMSCILSIFCFTGKTLLSAVSKKLRYIFRIGIQYCLIQFIDSYDCSAMRLRCG